MIKQFFNTIFSFFSTDIAMDLGTANTLVYITEKGIVLNEPSVVAVNITDHTVEAVGLEAKKMFGRTHSKVSTIRPMKDGVIADFDVTNKMIQYFIKKILHKYRFFKPRMVVGVPTCITQVEKKAVIDASLMAGIREVHLIEEPMAAAIGVGIPVHRPEGNMVIDIGGGTTDVAVISLSAIAYGESVRVAGDEIDESIVRYMRLQHHLNIGVFEGERVKVAVGSAFPQPSNLSIEVKGLNVKTGVPMSITIGDDEIREALKEPLTTIVTSIMRALEKIPPELSADIHSNGIYLTGGGALIRGLDKMIEERTTLKVFIPADPLLSIVKGAGAVLDDFDNMKKVCIN
jgi:rod shape-determining protein MreB and related proteins